MSIPIFISRPNSFADNFQAGYRKFSEFLNGHRIQQRTVGATDIPVNDPISEVITLMRLCNGAIILGIPQIEVFTGTLKGIPLPNQLNLCSEWNHIEASIAYTLGKPLFIIQHIGVTRGVFDRGAFPSFIHSVDMTISDWPWDTNINGAFQTWKGRIQG
jgi:hypothetical protein